MSEGHFERLDADECIRLLGDASIGRIAFDGPDGLTVLPLSYSVDEGRVVLRTAAGTQVAGLPAGTPVAFEVDDFDAEFRNGWSVVARGNLVHLAPEDLGTGVGSPQPFVPGERHELRGVTLESLSGRAVSAAG